MVAVAVTLGFFIGGGPSLLSQRGGDDDVTLAAVTATTAAPASSTTTAPPVTSTTSTSDVTVAAAVARPPREVSVRVYNGSTTAGQAVRVGDRVRAGGYQVLPPGPSPADPLPASVIHFVPGFDAEAAALAAVLGLPASAAAPAPTPALVKDVGGAELVVIVADDLVVPA